MKCLSERLTPVIILLLAVAARSYGLASQSLTADECFELETAGQSIREIIFASNSFPPLYHLLLKGWMFFDQGPNASRNLAFVIGILTLGVFWRLMVEAANRKTAIVALSLAAASPFHVYYSQEGRAYGLFLLLAILAVLYGLRLIREVGSEWESEGKWARIRDRFAFVAVSVAGGFTHYYFIGVLVSIALGGIAVKGFRATRKQFLPLALFVGVLTIPLFFLLPSDLENQRTLSASSPGGLTAIGYTFFSYESGYTLGPSQAQLQEMSEAEATRSVIRWVGCVGVVVGCLIPLGCLYFQRRNELAYWLVLLTVPFIFVGLLSLILGVNFNPRFVIFCWVPYCLLIATGFQSLLPKPRLALGIALAAIYGLALFNRHHVPEYQNVAAPVPAETEVEATIPTGKISTKTPF